MSLKDTIEADIKCVEDEVKRAEEAAIKWFHDQRVAQHNEAVDAIQRGNEDQPKTVSSVDELPTYDPDAVAAPVPLTPVMPATTGAPANVGHGTVTVVDSKEDDETPPKSDPEPQSAPESPQETV